MTRKDYILIAETIREARAGRNTTALNLLIERLKKNNPRFDSRRFIEACGTNIAY